MKQIFLNKIINRNFEQITIEELKIITNNEKVFLLNKTTIKKLEKIIKKNSIVEDRENVTKILQEELPPTMLMLSNLDKVAIKEGVIEIDFRGELLNNLRKMSNLQVCVFLDKVMKISKDFKINFFKNRINSLHEINGVVSKSFGLSLVFEIFKKGNSKKFLAIDYDKIDKGLLIDKINSQVIYHIYILEIISKEVLNVEESKILTTTKINKIIKSQIEGYINIIREEKKAIAAANTKIEQTWILNIEELVNKLIEENEYHDEEEDYE